MALNLRRVTVYTRAVDPRTGEQEQRLTEFHPALRLKGDGANYPLWIQDGQVYGEGGEAMHVLPDWFAQALGTCTAEALTAVGYHHAAPTAPVSKVVVAQRKGGNSGAYTCPECSETMWKVQIAAHRRDVHGGGAP